MLESLIFWIVKVFCDVDSTFCKILVDKRKNSVVVRIFREKIIKFNFGKISRNQLWQLVEKIGSETPNKFIFLTFLL